MRNGHSTRYSLTRRLFVSLLLPMLFIVTGSATISILVASRSINNLYDQQMKNSADVLSAFLHFEVAEHSEEDDDYEEDEEESVSDELIEIVSRIESEQRLSVNFRLKVDRKTLFTSRQIRSFPSCVDGFSQINISPEKSQFPEWRCYRRAHLLPLDAGLIVTEIFEPVTQRQEAIKSLILSSYLPLFFLPLLIFLIIYWGVSIGMKELHRFSRAVKKRSMDNLQLLSYEGKPRELHPVVDSVNQLLSRVESGIAREKRFTDDAAHELRTPITSIKLLGQLIQRDNKDPQLRENLAKLRDAIDQCQYLIEQLLRIARLQTRKSLNKEQVEMNDLVRDQLGLLSPQITAKRLSVEFNNDNDLIFLNADKAALVLLVNNVLSNAVKFNQAEHSIYIQLDNRSLRIEDDGPGIPQEDQSRIFDRFFRGASTHQISGSGLGLSLAKWVADMHGFELSVVEAVKGMGAAIELRYR